MHVNEDNGSTGNHIVPGKQHSLWIDTTPSTGYPALHEGIKVDIAIVGGGMMGITAASLLKDAGKSVAIIESDEVVKNVTGHTTAKITSQHGLVYHDLMHRFGKDGARIYAEANQSAIDKIEAFITQKNISCDFFRTPMFVYTELSENLQAVRREVDTAQKLGLPASFTEETPLPFKIKGAIRLENQAQFHPRKYLLALAKEIPGNGSYVLERTRALSIREDEPCVIVTDKGEIEADNVIIATQFPFYDTGLFYTRLYPYNSYALGVRIKGDVPDGMYFTQDKSEFAIRNQPVENGLILVISGGHHKVGQGGDTMVQYLNLEKHTRERFDVESIDYYWSTEDYRTPDFVPYIGKSPNTKDIYVAAGFGGWGMTNSTLAAMILYDLILERENPWSSFFNPSRIDILASGGEFISETANVIKQYGKGFLVRPQHQALADIKKGEGKKIVVDNKEIAAYKDEEGNVHTVSPICTHLGCTVNWNNAEKTWDCPCHGSRYNYDGKVIHGPALKDLRKVD